jgi:glycosyltransferase involved in cell wall biosynthesis
VICIADNISPHEKRPGDAAFTNYFLKPVHAFITMSEKVLKDLKQLTTKPAQQVTHPLYDNFGEPLSKQVARETLRLPVQDKIILFFGFIRHYKGLDILLQAMALPSMKQSGIKLLVAGEFYEQRKTYDEIIAENDLSSQLILRTDFIQDSEVKFYLSASDFVIQPYRNATQSGVTPLAYHFEKPMLVTNVGGLPDLVPNGKVGLVCEPTPQSIAEHILQLYQLGEENFLPHLREEKKKYSWSNITSAVYELTTRSQRNDLS